MIPNDTIEIIELRRKNEEMRMKILRLEFLLEDARAELMKMRKERTNDEKK